MNIRLLTIIIFFVIGIMIGISIGAAITDIAVHECSNEWWMRFGKSHLEVCDTIHERCFKRN